MSFLSSKEVETIRSLYPKGAIVRLIHMDDPYTKLTKGDLGTVAFVDDAGQIHVKWDRGSSLALDTKVDTFELLHSYNEAIIDGQKIVAISMAALKRKASMIANNNFNSVDAFELTAYAGQRLEKPLVFKRYNKLYPSNLIERGIWH